MDFQAWLAQNQVSQAQPGRVPIAGARTIDPNAWKAQSEALRQFGENAQPSPEYHGISPHNVEFLQGLWNALPPDAQRSLMEKQATQRIWDEQGMKLRQQLQGLRR